MSLFSWEKVGEYITGIGKALESRTDPTWAPRLGKVLSNIGVAVSGAGAAYDESGSSESAGELWAGIAAGLLGSEAFVAAPAVLADFFPVLLFAAGAAVSISPLVAGVAIALAASALGIGGFEFGELIGKQLWSSAINLLHDPLVLDLAGAGIQLTSVSNSQAYYDFSGAGIATKTGWIGPGQGLLVLNDNGNITLLGAVSGDGFADLAALANGAGAITPGNPAYSELEVWVDSNGNGVIDPGELYSLSALGITSISVASTPSGAANEGNIVVATGSFTVAGSTTPHAVDEVDFATNPANSGVILPSGFVYANEAFLLPVLDSYGLVPSLQASMSLDPTLLSDVQNLVLNSGSMSITQFNAAFQALVMEWAGASDIDPTSRGPYVNAQHLAVVYAFSGINQTTQPQYAVNPNLLNGPIYEDIFNEIVDQLEVRFVSQIAASQILNNVDLNTVLSNPLSVFSQAIYDPYDDKISVDLEQLVSSIISNAPTDGTAANYYALTFGIVEALNVDLYNKSVPALASAVTSILLASGAGSDVLAAALSAFGYSNVVDEGATTGTISGLPTGGAVLIGAGDKTLVGGAGNMFVYTNNGGVDSISNFGTGSELAVGAPQSDAIFQADAAGDLIVRMLDTGGVITFENDLSNYYGESVSQLSEVSFDDGTSITFPTIGGASTPITFTWMGTATDTTLTGSSWGVNVFDLGPGGDVVTTGSVNDTIAFDKGDGQAIVNLGATDQNGGDIALQLGADIAASDVILQADAAGDLTVALRDDPNDSITFKGDLSNYYGVVSQLKEIVFGDGTSLQLPVWPSETPITLTWIGTTADATLTGSSWGQNVFDLGPGGDAVTTASINDTIDFDKGDGQAIVNLGAINQNGGDITLQLGADIAAGDVILQADAAGDLTVALRDDPNDSITFKGVRRSVTLVGLARRTRQDRWPGQHNDSAFVQETRRGRHHLFPRTVEPASTPFAHR